MLSCVLFFARWQDGVHVVIEFGHARGVLVACQMFYMFHYFKWMCS